MTIKAQTDEAIRLINAENGHTIEQLTRSDLERLRAVAPDDLAEKLMLFIAWMEGQKRARLRTRSES